MPWTGNGAESELANLTGYTTVLLSFMQPDTTYAGGLTFEGTGLQFSSEPPVIREAIAALRAKGVKVLLAVGGATYPNWGSLNAAGIAAFVSEFELDGVDIDFEPSDPQCALGGDGTITCGTDELYCSVTRALREAIPRPALLTSATWSVGAYGEGSFAEAAPQGSPYTGVALTMLRSVGDLLDQVHVMAYDAGDDYDAKIAFDAYKAVYPGTLLMGVELPPDAVGGHSTSIDEVRALCEHVNGNGGGGVFVWSIQKEGVEGCCPADVCGVAAEVFGL